jgi:hypothetical protein
LDPENWSFFYPSVAASVLLDRVLNFQSVAPAISMAKLRLSWANVGNGGVTPYLLDQYYGASSINGGYSLPGTVVNRMIKPEDVGSWELGLDARFFHGRLGLDLAAYNSSAIDQIVSIPIDPITGASAMTINVGEITNKGIEVAVSGTPIKTANFTWDINVNWTKNTTRLMSLQEGWDPAQPFETNMGTTIGGRLFTRSYLGEEMYKLYGFALQKAPEGSYYIDANGNQVDCSGQVIIDAATGLPSLTPEPNNYLGKVTPDWRGGFSTSFRYKGLTFSSMFSYQYGGHRFSVTMVSYPTRAN